jgi:outer membrane lipoprotein carrier protein
MRVQFTCLLLAVGLVATPAVHTQTPSAVDLAQSLQKRYATIRDFKADFTQELRSGVLRTLRSDGKGQLKVKKPDRLWMTYTAPQKSEFIADGTEVKTYTASDRSGTRGPMPKGDDISVAILFLAGRGDLIKDFRSTVPATHPAGEWHLTLTPIKPQKDFVTLTLVVHRPSLALRGMTTVDAQGGTTVFRFNNLRENVGLKDSDFSFTFPPRAHVIYTGRDAR